MTPLGLGGGYLLSHFRSTIGVVRLNFSVRNGKRWGPHAISALMRCGRCFGRDGGRPSSRERAPHCGAALCLQARLSLARTGGGWTLTHGGASLPHVSVTCFGVFGATASRGKSSGD